MDRCLILKCHWDEHEWILHSPNSQTGLLVLDSLWLWGHSPISIGLSYAPKKSLQHQHIPSPLHVCTLQAEAVWEGFRRGYSASSFRWQVNRNEVGSLLFQTLLIAPSDKKPRPGEVHPCCLKKNVVPAPARFWLPWWYQKPWSCSCLAHLVNFDGLNRTTEDEPTQYFHILLTLETILHLWIGLPWTCALICLWFDAEARTDDLPNADQEDIGLTLVGGHGSFPGIVRAVSFS